jgi:hypothetical protein
LFGFGLLLTQITEHVFLLKQLSYEDNPAVGIDDDDYY